MNSALYEGTVRHRRYVVADHAFRYRLSWLWLDLSELDQVFAGRLLWSTRGRNLAEFRRSDYLGDSSVPLDEAVRSCVADELGRRPEGAVRVLTQPRLLGFCFNPVSFYYCYDAAGSLDAVVAEITNTPWLERHRYVLDARAGRRGSGAMKFDLDKAFHISPFMGMHQRYRWVFGEPGASLAIHMESFEDGRRVFDADLALERKPITTANLARYLVRFPAAGLQITAAIYVHALQLWWKGVPFHPHPKHTPVPAAGRT